MMMNEAEERKKSSPPGFRFNPTGFRFNPTDEQLIDVYLNKKIENSDEELIDVYHDPWELKENFSSYGGNEYYFFTQTDRKYAIGSRVKRVAGMGYWKSSGEVIPIYDSNDVEIGSKKVLVFYEGKHPNGVKTPWVMHEYKAKMKDAEGTTNGIDANARAAARSANGGDKQLDECVLCMIYKRVEEEPASTPAAQETSVNHLNINEAENTATRVPEDTLRYTYPGSDIYFGQDMVYFWRSNKVVGKIFKRAEEEPAAAPIEYKEEQNYDEVMFNVIEEYLVFPEGIDSLESLDP